MNKNRQNKALAAVLATSILVTGTFAWQSFSQLALNETITKGGIAGGRLHDYFSGPNTELELDKVQQVFVENYGGVDDNISESITADIFVRVKLSEYLEYGTGAGINAVDITSGEKSQTEFDEKEVTQVAGTDIDDTSTWATYKWGDTTSAVREYRTLEFGVGKTTQYMPTFNKNHENNDSDVNGSLTGSAEGYRHDDETSYEDYVDYSATTVKEEYVDFFDVENNKAGISEDKAEHTATTTGTTSKIYSMTEWLALNDTSKIGSYWVYDTDGWAYWAQPLKAGTTTGLLLNGMTEDKNVDGTYTYYAVHAEAQMATAGDWADAETPNDMASASTNAKFLLNLISADEVFTQPTTKLTTVTELSASEIDALVGTEDTVTVDGIEYYVLDRQTVDKYYAEDLSYGTVDSVLLWSADLVDVDDKYKSTNTLKGLGDHQVKFNDTNVSKWSTSWMRNGVLVDWMAEQTDMSNLALTTEVITGGYYTDSTEIPTTVTDDEVTYDTAYLLSQPEFLGYEIDLDNRYKVATMNQFANGDSSSTQYYWARSAHSLTSVRIVHGETCVLNGTSAIYSPSNTAGVGVRPAVWVIL